MGPSDDQPTPRHAARPGPRPPVRLPDEPKRRTSARLSSEPAATAAPTSPSDDPAAEPVAVATRRVRRLVPATALGLAGLLFCMGIAAAFSGAILYAYYESRQEATTNKVESFFGDFNNQLDNARKIIKDEGDHAKAEVSNQLDELQKFAASGTTLTQLAANAAPSVYFVSTLDSSGAPSVGSAFVAFSDSESSYLLTSYTTIAAATQAPAPVVTLRKQGADDIQATVFTWDAGTDVALLSVPTPNLPALKWADGEPKVGDRVFAISGLGASGAAITQGFVADVSASGIQHDAPIGTQFQGGPLLDSSGQVVGIASRAYAPLGFPADTVWFAPLVRQTCSTVLRCPDSGGPSAASSK